MKLIEILAREIAEWPSDALTINQDNDGFIKASTTQLKLNKSMTAWSNVSHLTNTLDGNWRDIDTVSGKKQGFGVYLYKIADDWSTSTITRTEWEAARAAFLAVEQKADTEAPEKAQSRKTAVNFNVVANCHTHMLGMMSTK